jgi:hypothetical protein
VDLEGFGVRHQAMHGEDAGRRRPGKEANPLSLEARVGQALDAVEAGIVLAINQNVGGVVIWVGVLDQPRALGIAHDEIAGVPSHRIGHITGRFGKPGIVEPGIEPLGDKLGKLVLEAFARFV